MEYRNIFIANPAKLSIQQNQLVIQQEQRFTVPLEDISSILIESRQVTLTASALSAIAEAGVTAFLCDERHMPSAVVLPTNQYCRQRKLLLAQVTLPKPLQKQLWQQIVKQKIRNQALCLRLLKKQGAETLEALADAVRSGDSDNREAVAAAVYFPALFGEHFSRELDCPQNAALNYGYAILRGCIARNLVVHGLEPCLGLHHCNAQNNFNLADDLIEPYRPLVDLYVSSYVELTGELTPKRKQQLFNLTSYLVKQGQRKYRLMTGVGRCCASLASCISEQSKGLELPQLIALEQRSNE